jgi:putative membrane protein
MPMHLIAQGIYPARAPRFVAALIPYEQLPELVVSTLVFSLIGLLLFALAFWIIKAITPFSLRKEIEEDHNVALAIVIASVIIGVGLIVSAAVHG